MYIQLSINNVHTFATYLKLTCHCKSTIDQYKIKCLKLKKYFQFKSLQKNLMLKFIIGHSLIKMSWKFQGKNYRGNNNFRNTLVHADICCCLISESCPTFCNPMNCGPPGPSVHGILQARILEWAAVPSSGGSSDPGIEPVSSALQADSLPLSHQGSTSSAVCQRCDQFPRS